MRTRAHSDPMYTHVHIYGLSKKRSRERILRSTSALMSDLYIRSVSTDNAPSSCHERLDFRGADPAEFGVQGVSYPLDPETSDLADV